MKNVILFIFICSIIPVVAQHNCSTDTLQMVKDIRASFVETVNHLDSYEKKKEGSVDFEFGSEEMDQYATGDNSWHAFEQIQYFDNSKVVLIKETDRNGAYQIGETKSIKEYYIKNGELYFYYEKEMFYSFALDGFESYVNEYRVYFCDEKPIRYLKKSITWPEHTSEMNYDNFYNFAINKISIEKNIPKSLNDSKIKEINMTWY